MRYAELQNICAEIHGGKCDRKKNIQIQKYLNQWSLNGTLLHTLPPLKS